MDVSHCVYAIYSRSMFFINEYYSFDRNRLLAPPSSRELIIIHAKDLTSASLSFTMGQRLPVDGGYEKEL